MPAHLALPIRVTAAGRLATVAQDSDADITQSVDLLLSTRPGERRSEPDYGLPDLAFGTQVDEATIRDVIGTWEDRATEATVTTLINQLEA